jgi:hypothetical protein
VRTCCIDGEVTAVVRARGDLVDHQPAVAALLQDEELDAQHTNVRERVGDAGCVMPCLALQFGGDPRRCHCHREYAVAMLIFGDWKRGAVSIGAACDEARNLLPHLQRLLQHALHAAHAAPRLARRLRAGDPLLALPVVTEPRGLEDAREEFWIDAAKIVDAADHGMRGYRNVLGSDEALFQRAILRDRNRLRCRRHTHALRQARQGSRRNVFELGGNRAAAGGEPIERIGVVISADDLFIGRLARR